MLTGFDLDNAYILYYYENCTLDIVDGGRNNGD